MAQIRRKSDDDRQIERLSPPAPGFDPGGEVGRMHADLARRLGRMPTVEAAPGERVVRLLSVGGGWGALAAGYAAVAWLILR